MPHDTPLITTIVAALVLAFIFGAIANRLRMPPLVGYLIAGVAVGPHSPGFVADQTLAPQLAEIGVILLMFGVGLNFSLRDLLSVRWVAIPGALIRLAIATALGVGLATLMGWSLLGGIVFGLALAVSSTVVLLKAMQDRHLVDSDRGHIAIGWLVVEDLAMVLALVLIPAFATHVATGTGVAAAVGPAQTDAFVALTEQVLHTKLGLWGVVGITLLKLLAFVGVMVVVGRRIIPFILHATAHTGSRELFRLAVLAIALGVAAGAAYLFGVSLALGAFFAGMILSESELSHRAAQETLPLRDAFGVLFFVSVGMLFDPSIIVREPLPVLATLAIILFGKTIVAFLLLMLFRRPAGTALTLAAGLAQIGEFSFILAALGVSLGVLPEEGRGLVLAGAIISIILNPLMFWMAERLKPRFETRNAQRRTVEPELGPVVPGETGEVVAAAAPGPFAEEEAEPTRQRDHVILIGYGRVGTVVGGELQRAGTPLVLVEDAEGRVHAAREAGIEVIVGNAATRQSLVLANVAGARCVVIAIPNAFEAGQATEQCRKLNPSIRIIARAHSDEEVEYLRKLGADEVIMGEREIGLGMIDWLKGQNREGTAEPPKLVVPANVLQASIRQPEPVVDVVPPVAPVAPEEPEMLVETAPVASPWPAAEAVVPPAAAALGAAEVFASPREAAAPADIEAATPPGSTAEPEWGLPPELLQSSDWSTAPEPAAGEPTAPPPEPAASAEPLGAALGAAPVEEPVAAWMQPAMGDTTDDFADSVPAELPRADAAWMDDPADLTDPARAAEPSEAAFAPSIPASPGVRVVPPSEIDILPPEARPVEAFAPPRERRIELEGELEAPPPEH